MLYPSAFAPLQWCRSLQAHPQNQGRAPQGFRHKACQWNWGVESTAVTDDRIEGRWEIHSGFPRHGRHSLTVPEAVYDRPLSAKPTYQEEFRKLNSGVTASDVVTLR
jgi:hypothetical protein